MSHPGDGQPLDIHKLKEIVRDAARGLSRPKITNDEALFTLALGLSAAVKKTVYERSEVKFSREPILEKRGIVQFVRRMRIDGMEKFNQSTVFSVIHFYTDAKQLEKNVPIGLIIVYMPKRAVPETLRLLKYPYIEDDEDEEFMDGCGAIANLIAGQFKREVIALGYKDLEMSHFKSFMNTAPNGVEFPGAVDEKYEISFHIEDEKRLVLEMVMDRLPMENAL